MIVAALDAGVHPIPAGFTVEVSHFACLLRAGADLLHVVPYLDWQTCREQLQ
jgi:hypothetical protein